jgi:cytoskeletal protein CcmA (bactofilin family)
LAYAPNLGTDQEKADLATANSNMEAAYDYAEGLAFDYQDVNGGILTEYTFSAGVYNFTTAVHITGNLYFDAADNADAVFVIQTTGNLIQDANYEVILARGAKAENIFWQVAGNVEVMAGAHMKGVILGKTSVTFITGSSLNGRILAQTACVLQVATITP